MKVTIWHNPRCSTSRKTLSLLDQHGLDPEIVEYLVTPPGEAELKSVLKKLRMRPRDLMRRKDPIYKELGLTARACPMTSSSRPWPPIRS